jgi:hypothetical protein
MWRLPSRDERGGRLPSDVLDAAISFAVTSAAIAATVVAK